MVGREAADDPLQGARHLGDLFGAARSGDRLDNGATYDEPSSMVRPYTVTGGRTAPRTTLHMETLVSTMNRAAFSASALTPEFEAICALCREVRSVAEISALLRMPLGVARVLVADMAAEGLVHIHQPAQDEGRPDLNLLERVLSGLRKL